MKVLYDWLKEFVDVTSRPPSCASRLSLTGTAVEGLEETPAGPLLDAELTINRPDLPRPLRHGARSCRARAHASATRST